MYHKLQSSLCNNKHCKITHNSCISCKYFHNSMLGSQYGKCSKFEKQDVISWKLQYSYASIVREYQCKGECFQEKQYLSNHILNLLYVPLYSNNDVCNTDKK